jgi:hypothetical protein
MSRIPVMQKPDGIFTNVLIVSSELTIYSDTCGLCFRRVVEIEEGDPFSTPFYTETPLPSSWTTLVGPQTAYSQKQRGADDFDFSGFKRIQIVFKILRFPIEETCELVRLLVQDSRTSRHPTALGYKLQLPTIGQQKTLLRRFAGFDEDEDSAESWVPLCSHVAPELSSKISAGECLDARIRINVTVQELFRVRVAETEL